MTRLPSETSGSPPLIERIAVGEQGGHLEYLVSEPALSLFRRAVAYPEASFPSMAAGEHLAVLQRKYSPLSLACLERQDTYYRPPQPGRRVQATGWVRGKRRSEGRDVLVLETFSVDEVGTEIARTIYTLASGGGAVTAPAHLAERPAEGVPLPGLAKQVGLEEVRRWEETGRLLRGEAGGEQAASGLWDAGSEGLSAAYLHEIMARRFGIDFRQGGRLRAVFLLPVNAGDALTGGGVIVGQEQQGQGTRFTAYLWLDNHLGQRVAEGSGEVTVPSPLT